MRMLATVLCAVLVCACQGAQSAPLKELQRAKSGPLNIVLLAPGDALKQGRGRFVLEFRDAGGALVDVGTVTVGASMPMPGMAPMFGDCMVTPAETKGRYEVASDLAMIGTWRLQVAWDGPAGRGSTSLPGSVL